MSADPAQVQLGFTKLLPLPVRSKPAGAGASPRVLRAATLAPVRARMMCTSTGHGQNATFPSPSPPGSVRLGPGCPPALVRESRQQARRSCMQPHAPPPGCSRGQAPGWVCAPRPPQPHYLRTTCSDTLMLRHRKVSAAQLSLNSFTGGELFRPCLGALAILKLPGEEGSPKPQRAQLPGMGE